MPLSWFQRSTPHQRTHAFHPHAVRTVYAVILTIKPYAPVNQDILINHQTVGQNVLSVQSAHRTKPASTTNVSILAHIHAELELCALQRITAQFAHAPVVTQAIHSFNAYVHVSLLH